jgi:hypothetical protein
MLRYAKYISQRICMNQLFNLPREQSSESWCRRSPRPLAELCTRLLQTAISYKPRFKDGEVRHSSFPIPNSRYGHQTGDVRISFSHADRPIPTFSNILLVAISNMAMPSLRKAFGFVPSGKMEDNGGHSAYLGALSGSYFFTSGLLCSDSPTSSC